MRSRQLSSYDIEYVDWRAKMASARRSGMTVLGKVVVPKPINLPSQRLENHGLDPNVEIVPKGTLSWGSRSSSSTSNPWGSLSQSPNTDGGTSSPSHLSARPSSGGSGTRPSTAGSDRAHESTASAWGPNSRPSSASGAVGSNQTSLALLRPRSAETRPSSSHLSRFAEASSENPVGWSSTATAEKLGVVHYKDEGFALTSGDFPMLGSEKEPKVWELEIHLSLDKTETEISMVKSKSLNEKLIISHLRADQESTNRLGSSSGGVALTKESSGTSETDDVSHNENVKIATVNSWSRDNPPYGEDGATYSTEKWQGHPRPYTGANMVSPPYDTWNCIPANNPQGGVWYRGPRGGPPYGTPASPASFPMEPFPYYHPHISAGPLANPPPVHPTGVRPRGHHPQSGDVYRHPVPDAFVRPAMPIRPGFYPGLVPYEGYYGPPRGYVNERDAAFPGMVGPSSIYNRYPSQNATDPNSQGRSSERGSTGLGLVSEKGGSSHSRDSQRSLKVLKNQHNCWDDDIVGQNGESSFEINQPPLAIIDQPRISSHTEMVDQPRISLQEKLGLDGNDGKPDLRRRPLAEEASFNTTSDQETHASYPIKLKSSHENVGNLEAIGDFSLNKLELQAIGYSEVPQFSPAATKDCSLIQKIEELNVKARAPDGRHNGTPIYSMEEEGNRIQDKSVKTTPSENEDCVPVYSEKPPVDGDINSAPNEISLSSIDKSNGRGAISISRSTREMLSKVGHCERNFFTHDVDERMKRSPADSQGMVMASCPEISNVHVGRPRAIEEADSFPLERHEGESVQPVFDSNVDHVQRAKMRELAKQRTKQLQEEEEERTRKQKAKAWAKLEELNRRTQVEAEPTQSNTFSDVIKDKQEESITFGAIRLSDYLSGKFSRVVSKAQTVAHKIEKSTIHYELPVLSTENVKGGCEELVEHNQLVSLNQDVNVSTTAHNDSVSQIHDGNSLNLKRVGYKDKQSLQSEKKSTENSTFDNVHEAQVADINASLSEPNLHVTLNSESSTHPRKKNNKSGKNKNKVEDVSLSAMPTSLSEEKDHTKSGKPISKSEAVTTSVQPLAISEEVNHSSDQFSSLIEDSQEKGNGQGKSQHCRRTSRNLHGRSSEKYHSNDAVIWAPVRSLNKSEVTDAANQKTEVQASSSSIKADQVQSNSKNKRAEMERYVPKPVAREMAQQGSIQQPEVCSKNQTTSDDNRSHSNSPDTVDGKTTGSTTGNVQSASESRIGNGKHYKQSKSHRLWQQRGDAELKNEQGLQDQSASKSVEPQQLQKAHESYSDEWNPLDGWNIPNSDSVSTVTSLVARDQGNTGRGKQHQFKGQRVLRNNFDLDKNKLNSVEDEKKDPQSLENDVGQRDFTAASKENRGFGDRSVSHWQPKGFPSNNRQRNRSNDSQNIKKESSVYSSSFQKDQSNSEKGILNGPNAYQQEAKFEKKTSIHRGRPHSPNEGPVDLVEIAPASTTDARSGHRPSSGFHKGRLSRGSNTFRDSSSGHDYKQHDPPAYRERPKHNFHYEYQLVGPHGSNKSYNSDEPKDNAASRNRERSRNNMRQEGAHSRQVHV